MAKRRAELVILCEDTQQEVLIRYWLEHHGFNPRKFRIVKSPLGAGSGEQFVRIQYSLHVKVNRQKASYSAVGSALVVAIDADLLTVEERKQSLDDQLVIAGQNPRQTSEKIALLIPKRNIETWVHYVGGNSVDETTVYPKFVKTESHCKDGVRILASAMPQSTFITEAPLSLQIAIFELQRIL